MKELTFLNWDVLYDFAIGGKGGKRIFKDIVHGKYGTVYTTDYILIRVIDKLIIAQKKDKVGQLLTILYGGIKEEPQLTDKVNVLKIEKPHVEEARRWFFGHQMDAELDFVDWSTVSLMKDKNDADILTFDACFDTLREIKDETLPRVVRIAVKRPKQLMGARSLFIVGMLSLFLIPILALASGYLNIVVQDIVYISLAIIAVALIIASVFGKRAGIATLGRLSK